MSVSGPTTASGLLRIAMISYYLPSESKIGVGHQVHALANELVDRGHSVDVFSPCAATEGARYRTITLPSVGRGRTFRFAFTMRRQDLSGYDVLHAHGEDYWMWRRRVPVHVRTLHGSCFEEARRIRGVKEKLRMVMLGLTEVLASVVADTTVLVSPQTRRWTPWVRTVIPNGVDAARFAAVDVPKADVPTVLFVGTWRGRKRGAELAGLFTTQVRPRVPNAQLRMVTQDAPEDLPGGIVALGRLSDEDLAVEYARAWVFCLPSSYEGFGIPYAEAMSAGVPVVATPNPGARYVTENGAYGRLVDLADVAESLIALLTDDVARASLARAGRLRSAEFELGTVADRYEQAYRSRSTAVGLKSRHSSRLVQRRAEP
ncbi:glycosyltransferase family 4 protein [Microbacterium marinum]|uniref:glycosyltransferase family 4 protein n=1 Tax=Microbacterium marinum TaxID=421115 RepID=UPI00385164A0